MTELGHSQTATDEFRYGGQGAILLAVVSAALALLLIAAAWTSPGFRGSAGEFVALVLGLAFLGALAAVPLWLRARTPVLMRVGPEGIELPMTWSGPLPWGDIRRIRAERSGGPLVWRIVLIAELADGVLPPYRLLTVRRLELWYLRRAGLRVPISSLDSDPDAVIASIRRFLPVARQVR